MKFGFEALQVNLRNTAERSSRGAREELIKGAKAIQELAIRQAPVDEGNLEKSIKVGSELLSGRKMYTVYVDESVSASTTEHPGLTVGDYAERMHESVYGLGILSEAKQDANPDIRVGRKFLERAMDDLQDEIAAKVEAKVNQGIGH